MAVRTVCDCDRCGVKDISQEGRLQIRVGYSSDPAGGPASADYEHVDLCPRCMAAMLHHLVSADKVDGKYLVKQARTKVPGKK